jgi:peroxiredoxin
MYGREGVLRSAFLVDEAGRVARAWYRVKADQTAAKLLDALGG